MTASIVVLGSGKIGRTVAHFLARGGGYSVRVGDLNEASAQRVGRNAGGEGFGLDFGDAKALDQALASADAVVSCAPYHCNPLIAERAVATKTHYFDLTEDVKVTEQVVAMADGAPCALAPQCGLAPGFITVAAMHVMDGLDEVESLRMRVGALPRFPSNRLQYNLTWSTEGLINEYCNPCDAVVDGEMRQVSALEHLERLTVDGVEYEAFNTSGGLGTLADSLHGKVRNLNYKSMRYPGHNDLLKLLLDDLKMRDHQEELVRIFDRALPATPKDQVVVFVSATGMENGRLVEKTYANTVYHGEVDGEAWSAIQITTASGVCATVDLVFEGVLPQQGLVRQESTPWPAFCSNRFGRNYVR